MIWPPVLSTPFTGGPFLQPPPPKAAPPSGKGAVPAVDKAPFHGRGWPTGPGVALNTKWNRGINMEYLNAILMILLTLSIIKLIHDIHKEDKKLKEIEEKLTELEEKASQLLE